MKTSDTPSRSRLRALRWPVAAAAAIGLLVFTGAMRGLLGAALAAMGGFPTAVILLVLATALVLFLLRGLFCAIRPPRRPRVRRYWIAIILSAFVHAGVTLPVLLAWFATSAIDTRGDERAWPGPRIDREGRWDPWTREDLAAALRGGKALPESGRKVSLEAADGVRLRAFHVSPRQADPRGKGVGVVLVHGLFRSGVETAPVASLWRELGAEVLMVELRNHGGSERAPFTAGVDEAQDVRAAVAWLSARCPRGVVLWGVSLGAGSALRAAVHEPRLAGLWLDCPLVDVRATGLRMLTRPDRLNFPEPLAHWVLRCVEWMGDIDFEAPPALALAPQLNPEIRLQVVGAVDDQLTPLDEVRKLHDGLPSTNRGEFWAVDSDHGHTWRDAPEAYRQRCEAFLARLPE